MKYAIRITSDTGKAVTVAGREWLYIDVISSNKRIAAFTVRNNCVTPDTNPRMPIR